MIPVYINNIPIGAAQAGQAVTPWKMTDFHISPFQLAIACVLGGGGAFQYSVQYTYDDFWTAGQPAPTGIFNDAALNNATANGDTTFNNPITGWRISVGTVTTPGTLSIRAVQAGMP